MKRIFPLLLVILFSLSGCENDENDSLTGSWKVHSTVTGQIESTTLDECDADIIYHFESDKVFWKDGPEVTSTGYICQPALGGIWKKLSSTTYALMNQGTMFIEIVKVDKDTIIFQNIDSYPDDFKKILVRH